MTTYNTKNPVGSTDARDLYDNAENLDAAMNGPQDHFTDRLGVQRRTFRWFEATAEQKLQELSTYKPTGDLSSTRIYNRRDVAITGGIAYAALTDGLNGATFAADLAAGRWAVFQGITRPEFEAEKAAIVASAQAGAQTAQAAAEAARDAAFVNAAVYPDTAAGLAATTNGQQFQVVSADGLTITRYRRDSATVAAQVASYPTKKETDRIAGATGKNKLNPALIRSGKYYSPSSNAVVGSGVYRCSGFIPVESGKTYFVSGVEPGMAGGWFASESDSPGVAAITNFAAPITAPAGAAYLVVNITNNGGSDTSFDGTAQVEEGTAPTAYESYKRGINPGIILGDVRLKSEPITAQDLGGTDSDTLIEQSSYNLIDPAACVFTKRYSTGNKSFVTDALLIAASGYIPVTEGEFYTLSGAAYGLPNAGNCQGGYFTSSGATVAASNIVFFAPVIGPGAVFQVPTGQGITHVVVSLKKTNAGSPAELAGPCQLEIGEMATAYTPFQLLTKIKDKFLPQTQQSPAPAAGVFDDRAWYQYTQADDAADYSDKIPLFRKNWLLCDKDLCVVNTGTSLTARTTEHCTDHPDAAKRPPLMHSRNFASHIWDRLRWENQQYRRYDAPGVFTETGSWVTASNLPEWDDGPYRAGLTRYASGSASVQFQVPAGAWQFNIIYRTDSQGTTAAMVSVQEGNGVLEALADSGSWVEANGFVFSQLESAPVSRVVSVPNPSTDVFTNVTIPSKGNTTYQKRLKMRAKSGAMDSRASVKTVTVSSASGRLMYWGVEWSPRQYMITYINAARGSHATQATAAVGLPRFQDNEIWQFKPSLLLFELPIHNDGVDSQNARTSGYWARLTNNFVYRADYELSLKSRGVALGFNPEIAMFTASIAYNFGGIAEDGTLKTSADAVGKVHTTLDRWNEAVAWVRENHPNDPCIHATQRWVNAGLAIHGDLKTATLGSGKSGATFTNEGSHWNDTGSKIMAKAVLPLLKS